MRSLPAIVPILLMIAGSRIVEGCATNVQSDVNSVNPPPQGGERLLQLLTNYMIGSWDNSDQVDNERKNGSKGQTHPYSAMEATLFNDHIENIPDNLKGNFILWRIMEHPRKSPKNTATLLLVLLQQTPKGHIRPVIQEVPKDFISDLVDEQKANDVRIDYNSLGHLAGGGASYIFNHASKSFNLKESYPISNVSRYVHEERVTANQYEVYVTVVERGWPLVGYAEPIRYRKRSHSLSEILKFDDLTRLLSGRWDNKQQVEEELAAGFQLHPRSSITGKTINSIGGSHTAEDERIILWRIEELIKGQTTKKTVALRLVLSSDNSIKATLFPNPALLSGTFESPSLPTDTNIARSQPAVSNVTVVFIPSNGSFTIDRFVPLEGGNSYYLRLSVNDSLLQYYESEIKNGVPLTGFSTSYDYRRTSEDVLDPVAKVTPTSPYMIDRLMKYAIGQWDNREQVKQDGASGSTRHPSSKLTATQVNERLDNWLQSSVVKFVLWKREWEYTDKAGPLAKTTEHHIMRYRQTSPDSIEVTRMEVPNLNLVASNPSLKINFPDLKPARNYPKMAFRYQPQIQTFLLKTTMTYPNGTSFLKEQAISDSHISEFEAMVKAGTPLASYGTPMIYSPTTDDAPLDPLGLIVDYLIGSWDNKNQVERESIRNRLIHPYAELKISPISGSVGNIPPHFNGTILIRHAFTTSPGRSDPTRRVSMSIMILRNLANGTVHRLLYNHDTDQGMDFNNLKRPRGSGVYSFDAVSKSFSLMERDDFHLFEERLYRTLYEVLESNIYDGEFDIHYETPIRYVKRDV